MPTVTNRHLGGRGGNGICVTIDCEGISLPTLGRQEIDLTSLAVGHSRIDALASSLSALEAPCDLIVIVHAAGGERDEERADDPFARVNFGAAKDEMSEAVVGKASSGNGED